MPGFNIGGSGGDVDAKRDILRSYRWKVNIKKINRKYLDLALEADPPDYDFEVLEVEGLSLKYKIPRHPKFGNISLTFYDVDGLQQEFENWMDKMWNPIKGLYDGGNTGGIKDDISVELLDSNGDKLRSYTLQGAFPKRLSHSKLNMADNSLKTLVVEFAYDYYTMSRTASSGPAA